MFGVVGPEFLRQKGVCGQAYSEFASRHHLCWTGGHCLLGGPQTFGNGREGGLWGETEG